MRKPYLIMRKNLRKFLSTKEKKMLFIGMNNFERGMLADLLAII